MQKRDLIDRLACPNHEGTRHPRILVVGSSNTDLVLNCSRLPLPGETLMGGKFSRSAGGKGANQAVAAARAGGRVTFVGARGDDDFGRFASETLKREGIDLRHFSVRKKASSGTALVILGGAAKENMIVVAKAANETLRVLDVRKAGTDIFRSQVVVAQLEVPLAAVQEAARLAVSAGVPFVLNPAPARKLPASLLKEVDVLTPNEHEAELLTGRTDPEEAGRKLLALGCGHVVITAGAKGAILINSDGVKRFLAPKVKPRDTVGAGDCFTGWLAVGIGEGLPMDESVQRALVAASLSVTRLGAQTAIPRREEVLKAWKSRRKRVVRHHTLTSKN